MKRSVPNEGYLLCNEERLLASPRENQGKPNEEKYCWSLPRDKPREDARRALRWMWVFVGQHNI